MLTIADLGAAVIATVANVVLGMLWYSPLLFANVWMKEAGMTPKLMKKASMAQGMVIGVCTAFVTSLVIIALFHLIKPANMLEAMTLTVLWAIGFVIPYHMGAVAWEQKSMKYFLINAGWSVLALFVTSGIVYSWPK